ncbi:MFS transporter [Kitasatospora viridis]|uniref:EmrB/QacA subfamily drug resistance transporter n=1 Tax=Kitasatospora viridis TaxID=281105 RepID=A0A561T627_9ACTN|nr:MFS transporter [Kitasatospora viridis]TWF82567.1 EmrB/QacA subfamily drug resistance transporter [Kitasatospora viridis]
MEETMTMAPERPVPPEVLSGRRWTVAATALAAAMMTLDITVVNVALPRIGADLHTSLESLQWVVSAYTLAFAALLLTAGSVSDRIGRRRIFLAGVAVFTAASASCALAPSVGLLIAARAAQGVGGALAFGTALALIAGAYQDAPARTRTTAIGLFTAGGAVSAALGPLIGGSIVQWLSWPFLFAVNVPIGLFVLFVTARRVPESVAAGAAGRIDWAGAVLAVLALFALNYGLLTGAQQSWSRPDVLAALIAGSLLAVAFAAVQWRLGPAAMLDLRLFTVPTFSGAVLLSFAARIFSFGLLPFLTLWLGGMLGLSPFRVGLVLLAQSAALVVTAAVSGRLVKVLPVSRVLALGTAVVGVGMFLGTGLGPADGWTAVLPTLLLLGAGAGLTMPHLLSLAVEVVPPDQAGTASGTANTFFPLGTAAGVAGFGTLLTAKVNTVLSGPALARLQVPQADGAPLRRLVAAGQFDALRAAAPAATREQVVGLARSAYTGALSTVFLVAGIAALLAAAASLVLVRERDLRSDSSG